MYDGQRQVTEVQGSAGRSHATKRWWSILLLAPLLAGCQHGPAALTEGALQVRDAQSRLEVGMSEREVVSTIGQPTLFRSGGGRPADVAVYQFPGGRMTVYFYDGRLTRARSVRPPVNR